MRPNESGIIIGRKATGKSTRANALAKQYVERNPSKRALIIDVNGAPAYAAHPRLRTSQELKRWRADADTRIMCYYESDHVTLMQAVAQHFRNGLVIFEDCTKYINSNPSVEVKALLVDHRMWNCDMLYTFHSFNRVPIFFWEMTAYIMLLKTQDDINTPRNRRVIPNFKEVAAAHKRVMANKDAFYCEVVDTLI
jgi:hypothetical protein